MIVCYCSVGAYGKEVVSKYRREMLTEGIMCKRGKRRDDNREEEKQKERVRGFTLTAMIDKIFLIGMETSEPTSFAYIECAQRVSCLISFLTGFLVV